MMSWKAVFSDGTMAGVLCADAQYSRRGDEHVRWCQSVKLGWLISGRHKCEELSTLKVVVAANDPDKVKAESAINRRQKPLLAEGSAGNMTKSTCWPAREQVELRKADDPRVLYGDFSATSSDSDGTLAS